MMAKDPNDRPVFFLIFLMVVVAVIAFTMTFVRMSAADEGGCISLTEQVKNIPPTFENNKLRVVLVVWENPDDGTFTLYAFRHDISYLVGMQFYDKDQCLLTKDGDPQTYQIVRINAKIQANVAAGEVVYRTQAGRAS